MPPDERIHDMVGVRRHWDLVRLMAHGMSDY